jgi:hypothetical protein
MTEPNPLHRADPHAAAANKVACQRIVLTGYRLSDAPKNLPSDS